MRTIKANDHRRADGQQNHISECGYSENSGREKEESRGHIGTRRLASSWSMYPEYDKFTESDKRARYSKNRCRMKLQSALAPLGEGFLIATPPKPKRIKTMEVALTNALKANCVLWLLRLVH